jgi:hypothetical protein
MDQIGLGDEAPTDSLNSSLIKKLLNSLELASSTSFKVSVIVLGTKLISKI